MTPSGSRVLVALRVDADAARAFRVFTEQIEQWWRPHGLFQFTDGRSGTLTLEPELGGRLVETYDDGTSFEIGRVLAWDPPHRVALGWRHASFGPGQRTEVHVRFDEVGDQTRVTVEHFGWDGIPADHAARHGVDISVFQLRLGEWWRQLLRSLSSSLVSGSRRA